MVSRTTWYEMIEEEQEVIGILTEEFYCDGGDEFGHPRVYYTMKNGEAVCGYCNIKYVLVKE